MLPGMKLHPVLLESLPYLADVKVGDFRRTALGPIARVDYPNGSSQWFAVNGDEDLGIVDVRFAVARPPRPAVYDAGGEMAVPAETLEDVAREHRTNLARQGW